MRLRNACIACVLVAVLYQLATGRCGSGGTEYKTTADGRLQFVQLTHPEYPCAITAFNFAVRALSLSEWLLPLNIHYVLAKASESTKLVQFGKTGDPWFLHLRQLLGAIESEADLSPIGRFMAQQQTIKSLEQRAKIVRLLGYRPEILQEPLKPPLIITGMPRTGTTLLHNLLTLSGHPEVQHLTYAATLQPAAAASGPEHEAARTEVEQAVMFMQWMRPLFSFSSMHEMEAGLPHEELHLQALSFAAMLFESQYHIPSYGRMYENETDHTRSYWYVRELLQLRQHLHREAEREQRGQRGPAQPGTPEGTGTGTGAHTQADTSPRTWVLKSPMHLESSDALLHAFPEGFTLVRMHRDPFRVVLSLATMLAYIQALQSDRPKPRRVLEYWVGRLERMLRKADADDERLRGAPNVQVVDLSYDELVDDPAGIAERCLASAGLQVGAEVRSQLQAYVSAHPRNATGGGRFRYSLDVFGSKLTEAQIRQRFLFYTEKHLRPASR